MFLERSWNRKRLEDMFRERSKNNDMLEDSYVLQGTDRTFYVRGSKITCFLRDLKTEISIRTWL